MGGLTEASPEPASLAAAWRDAQEHIVKVRARSLLGYWRNLRNARRYRLRVLPDDLEVTSPPNQIPACGKCNEPCCASPRSVVSLRLLDVARLVDAGYGDAIAVDEAAGDWPKETRTAIAEQRELDTWRYFPWLQKRSDGSCILFENGICVAYEHRPLQCRAFPLQVDESAAQVRWASFCRSTSSTSSGLEHQAAVEAARESYHEKVRDLLTLVHAPDAVSVQTKFPSGVRARFAQGHVDAQHSKK